MVVDNISSWHRGMKERYPETCTYPATLEAVLRAEEAVGPHLQTVRTL